MKKKNGKIQKKIDQIINPYPEDTLIINYSDFLEHRDSLPHFQFNLNVLDRLLELCLVLWDSKERISRISLLEGIKRFCNSKEPRSVYLESNKKIAGSIPEIRKKVFLVFKKCFDSPEVLTEKQLPEAKKICNALLLNVSLEKEEEQWMCSNFNKSNMILNRILRYPKKSEVITAWVKEQYHNDKLRNRRAELLSWMMDDQPNFILEKQTLIDDFNYFNDRDREAIQEVKQNFELNQLLSNQIGNKTIDNKIFDIPGFETDSDSELESKPLKLSKRFYNVPTNYSSDYFENFPDFEELDTVFRNNLDIYHKVTMMWGIGYSRLNKKKKSILLIKNYCTEAEPTFFRICQRCKLIEPLEWLKV